MSEPEPRAPAPPGEVDLDPLATLARADRLADARHDAPARQAFAEARAALRARGAPGDDLRAAYAGLREGECLLALRSQGAGCRLLEEALAAVGGDAPEPAAPLEPPPARSWLHHPPTTPARAAGLRRLVGALALRALGLSRSYEGDYDAAVELLARAGDALRELGCPAEEAQAWSWQAIAHTKRGEADLALQAHEQAARCARAAGDAFRAAIARSQSAYLFAVSGQQHEATRRLDEGIAALEARGLPRHWPLYAKARNLEHLDPPRWDEAFDLLRRAFDDLIEASRTVWAPSLRGSLLESRAKIVTVTLRRAWRRAEEGALELDALHTLIHRAKQTVLADLACNHGGALLRAGSPAWARYQRLRRQLIDLDDAEACKANLAHAPDRTALLAELADAEAALEGRERALVGARVPAFDELTAALPAAGRAVLLDFLVVGDADVRVVLVARDAGGGWTRRLVRLGDPGLPVSELPGLFAAVTDRARELLAAGRLAAARELYRTGAGGELLRRLGEALLGAPPVAAALADADELIVVPHGALFAVPWALLTRQGRFLVEDLACSLLPTTTLLLRHPPSGPPPLDERSAVLFLVAGQDAEANRLAAEECSAALTHGYENVCLLKGALARREELERVAGAFDMISFVGHAAREEPATQSYLALGTPRPDRFDRFTTRDVRALDLRERAPLVVLSACEGAASRGAPGELDVLGAWLLAGARAVVASRHRVQPDLCRAVIGQHLYAGLRRGEPPQAALRRAALELLAGGQAGLDTGYHAGAFVCTYAPSATGAG